MQEIHDADPLNFNTATSRWFVESSKAQDEVAAKAAGITLSSTWLVGGDDPLTDPAQSKRVSLTMKLAVYHELRGFLHEVFNETDREQPFKLLTETLAAIS